MAYNPVEQRDPIYYQDPRVFNQHQLGYELQSTAPSFTSYKNDFVAHGTPAQEETASDHQYLLQAPGQNAQGTEWRPGVWKRFPVLPILSLLGVLGSTVASLVILIRSHKQPLPEWGYGIAPSVYLAIFSVVANALTAYALANGLEITFWRNCMEGRTLAAINQNWLCGHNLYNALLQGYQIGGRITALACILSVLAMLRGPLNQRASTVQSNVGYETHGELRLALAQKLPEGYAGVASDNRGHILNVGRLTPDFTQIMQDYSQRLNISMSHADCGDSCQASVKGFGFKTQCSITENTEVRGGVNEFAFNQPVFVTSTSLYPITDKRAVGLGDNYLDVGMRFNTTYRVSRIIGQSPYTNGSLPPQTSRFKSHVCNVTGGLVEYKVRLSSQTISLAGNRSEDRFLADQVMAGPGTWGRDSTIGGFEYAASYMFSSQAIFVFAGARTSIALNGSLANEMIRGVRRGTDETFDDPMEDMLDKFREIAFRTSVRAGRDRANVTDAQQSVSYQGIANHSIYVTDFRYMIAAAVVSAASVIAISITFYGWWQLGRTATFSPLEIAKAFDAPLLAQVGSNVNLSDNSNLGAVGATRVQYGVRADEAAYTTQYAGGQVNQQRRRLVMGPAGQVGQPNRGDVFGN